MSDLERIRRFALSLPGTTEERHFDMSSFRVRGKIFATLPPDGGYLHVFVDEGESRAAAAEDLPRLSFCCGASGSGGCGY